MFWLIAITASLAMELWTVPKLTCSKCANDITAIANSLPSVELKSISLLKKQFCFSGDGTAMMKGMNELDYAVTAKETVDRCPSTKKSPWSNPPPKVMYISTGERFEYKNHLTNNEYTLFDFGATWCGPCFRAADKLRDVLKQRTDLNIRVIDLDAPAKEAFGLPVAKQHLAFAPGIPWLVLYGKDGKKKYEGPVLDEVLKRLK